MQGLKPHQVPAWGKLLRLQKEGKNTIDLSDTGTGKTYVAAALAVALNLPTLAVVPKISMTSWRRALEHFGEKISIVNYEMLRTGRTEYGTWENNPPPSYKAETFFKCQSCQREVDLEKFEACYCHSLGIHCVETKKVSWDYGRFHWAQGVKLVIFDESQRCNGINSLNADMMCAARREGKRVHLISATAACSPLHMRAMGYVLGLHSLINFYGWARRWGCGKIPGIRGVKWLLGPERQREVMGQLHDEMTPVSVRLRTKDIPNFPARTITAELYDLNEADKIDELYVLMGEALADLEQRSLNDLASDHPLTQILRARQKIELLKVPLAVELAQDYLDRGVSVAIFVNFRQTLEELRARLKWKCFIDGSSEGVKKRQEFIDLFQADEENGIIVNNAAGGLSIGLHDVRGERSRAGIVFPDFSADKMRQLFGRLPREGGKSPAVYRILLAAKTVEEKVYKALKPKLDNLDALNDLDLLPESLHLTKRSLTSLLECV